MSGSSSTRDLIGVELSASSLPDVSQDYYLAPGPHSDNEKAKRLLMGLSLLCAIFIVIEIIGGYIANSVAVMTDACHMFSDLMSIFVSLFAIRISRQPANPRFTSGFYRAEVLGAMLSLTILWVLTFFLVFLAARKIMDGKLEVDANSMIILALIGCFFNLVMFAATRQSTSSTHTHWHSHSISSSSSAINQESIHSKRLKNKMLGVNGDENNSHQSTGANFISQAMLAAEQPFCPSPIVQPSEMQADSSIEYEACCVVWAVTDPRIGKRVALKKIPNVFQNFVSSRANMNIRAAVTHIIGDLVQSIGVLVAAIIIKIFGWTIADPICTFIFSIIVIVTTFELTCDIVMILMEGTPKHLNYEDMHNDLKDITGVRQVHDLRIWSLSMTEFAVVAHLVIDESIAANSTTQQAVGLLRSKYNVHFVTIQIEFMLYPLLLYFAFIKSVSTVVFSCGGYVKSADIPIDYSQIQVKLLNSDGNLKFEAGCNPSNGFYMIPVYAKGEYTIRIFAPEGIYFEPNSVSLNIGGVNDPCSKGEDINFLLKGLGIKGALRYSDNSNAKNVKVSLLSSNGSSVTTVSTDDKGIYQFNVLPGKYLVSLASIGGTSECVEGDKISVEVVASPVQISSDMKILGHELTVEIMSKNQALPDITVNLYSSNSVQLRNCQNSDPTSSQVEGLNLICSSKSNQLGQVQFKCVPSGQYLLVPRLITNKVQFAFSPKSEKFAVGTKSKKITFAVSGFISRGRVLIQAKSVENAEIYVNGELRTTSDKNGWYTTEGLHDGRYSVTAKKKGYAFGTVIVHLSNLNAEIPDLHVESAEVCARIEAEDEVQISTNFVIVAERTGQRASVLKAHKEEKVCTMLPLGRYIISVDSTKKITVAPRQQVVSTLDGPKQDVIFVKTTTKIIAKTKCKGKCPQLKVELRKDGQMIRTLSGTDEFVFEKVASDSYTIKIVHSGEICWDTPAIDVVIEGSDSYSVEFVQQGYLVMINSSHSAELNWEHKMQRNLSGSVNMEAGISRICLPELGVYSVAVQGCHTFGVSSDQLIVPQDSLLSAMAEKAQILVRIIAKESVAKLPDFRIIVNAGDERRVVEAPVSKKSSEFNYVFHLKMGDVGVVTISPESDLYLFLPVAYRFEFDGECHEMHEPFVATKGIFLHGSVTPAIENVEIKLIHKTDSNVIQKSVTDSNGRYRIGPLQDVMSFNIEAAKEGYEFEQMETFGNIKAWRLSQLQVVVTDIQTSLPLHDVLLSLSGTGNYRSSNLLNETGWMNFIGLHAGEYFLQPFLQEYRFEPSTTSVKINEGETVVAELKGRRFAYSATGSVTYLGGSPATIVIVEAVSEQCNQLQEEDTTSESGIYRIRGLHPNCIYRLVLKSSEGQRLKSYPTYCDISVREEDVGNINFALTDIERPVDIVGSVEFADATPPQFKIVLYRGDSMIQHAIVDSPSQVFFFDIPYVDYLEYTVRYEPSHVSADYKYQTSEVSFSANSTVIRVHLRVDIQKSGDVEIAFTSYFAFPFFLFIGYIFFYHEKIIPSTATIMDKLSKLQTMKHNAVPWENQDHHRKRMKAKKVIHADANAGIR